MSYNVKIMNVCILFIFVFLSSDSCALDASYFDSYADMANQSASIVRLDVRQGKAGNKKFSYLVDYTDVYAGNKEVLKNKKINCDCKLKIGGSYLAFVYYNSSDGFYIRGAYEILGVKDDQVEKLGLSGPIVLVDDSSTVYKQPLFIIRSDPKRYDMPVVVEGKLHKVPVNGWYPLDDVLRDIMRRRRSMDGH